MPANPISKHQRQTVQHVLWVLPKFCQLSDISKLKRNWYTLVKYVYHYFSHGYLFPDRKKIRLFHDISRKDLQQKNRTNGQNLLTQILIWYYFFNKPHCNSFGSWTRDRPKPILLVLAVAETVAETEDTHSAVAEPGAESLVLVSAETVAET